MRQISPTPDDDIEVYERYDQEDDIYYVTLRTGEPSFVEEFDDQLLVEKGFFTRLPTGFRILNYSKVQTRAATFMVSFKDLCKKLGLKKIRSSEEVEREMGRMLERTFA